jgi:hypothetical protein
MSDEPKKRVGACKLCGNSGPLHESHIVPRWMYRRSSRFYPGAGANPVQSGCGRSLLDPTQLTDYLLCTGCEARFRPWETYLSEVSLQEDDTFPGLDQLREIGGGGAGGQVLADASALNCDALARVALSIAWRASVSQKVPEVTLGTYEREVGDFLRGADGAPLPPFVRVLVDFTRPMKTGEGRPDRTVTHPYMGRVGGYRVHRFMTFGMWFFTCVGREIPSAVRDGCLATERRAFITDGRERTKLARHMVEVNPPTGTLARRPDIVEAFKTIHTRYR